MLLLLSCLSAALLDNGFIRPSVPGLGASSTTPAQGCSWGAVGTTFTVERDSDQSLGYISSPGAVCTAALGLACHVSAVFFVALGSASRSVVSGFSPRMSETPRAAFHDLSCIAARVGRPCRLPAPRSCALQSLATCRRSAPRRLRTTRRNWRRRRQ